MRKSLPIALCMALVGLIMAGTGLAQETRKKPVSLEERYSYGIGLNMGGSFKADGISVNLDALFQGIRDALGGVEPLLSTQEVADAMQELQSQLQARVEAKAMENAQAGEAFLAENKEKEGVKTTPSGLQYEILTPGTGPSPKATDTVRVHYRGTLIDGTQFDSSYDRGEPMTFGVNQVIAGWTEALQLMKVGAKWNLVIHPAIAYGQRGSPPLIGPNAVLRFQVELIGIE